MSKSTIKFSSEIKSGSVHNFLVKTIHSEWIELMRSDEVAKVSCAHWSRSPYGELVPNYENLTHILPDYRWIAILHEFVVKYKSYMYWYLPRIKMVRYNDKSVLFLDNLYYLPTIGTMYGSLINSGTAQPDIPEVAGVITSPSYYIPQGVVIGKYGLEEDFVLNQPERTMKYALGNVLTKSEYNDFDYDKVEVLDIGDWVFTTLSKYNTPSYKNDPYIKMGNEIMMEWFKENMEKELTVDTKEKDDKVNKDLTKIINVLKDIIGKLNYKETN